MSRRKIKITLAQTGFLCYNNFIERDGDARHGDLEESMQNCNSEFFDEFKRLDKLFREIYGRSADNKLGITLYIEDMDSKAHIGRARVECWTGDYNRLKRIRKIRNELAHSPNTFSQELCSNEDVEFVRGFYFRIMNGTDPLALYSKTCTPHQDRRANANRGANRGANSGANRGNVNASLKKVRSGLGILRAIRRIFKFMS